MTQNDVEPVANPHDTDVDVNIHPVVGMDATRERKENDEETHSAGGGNRTSRLNT